MDFRSPQQRIGERIGGADAQIHAAGGYDHTWVDPFHGGLALALPRRPAQWARAYGIYHQPGVQFYSGNFMMAHTDG
ncbi:MAG: hypothetical protein U0074_10790 [Kouleothrix sp.]